MRHPRRWAPLICAAVVLVVATPTRADPLSCYISDSAGNLVESLTVKILEPFRLYAYLTGGSRPYSISWGVGGVTVLPSPNGYLGDASG